MDVLFLLSLPLSAIIGNNAVEGDGTITLIECESRNGTTVTPSCPPHGRITILYANYGRTVKAPEVCPYDRGVNLNYINCTQYKDFYMQISRRSCDGKNSCSVTKQRGDPCPNTYKYLEVRFNCTKGLAFLPTEFPALKTVQINERGLVLTCKVRGHPEPSIAWTKDDRTISELDGFYEIETKATPDADEFNVTSFLYWRGPSRTPELDSLRNVDAGSYTCQAGQEKSQDVLTQEMRLNVQSTPEAPTNLKVQGIAWDSAVLEWQAGSDGGSAQHFIVAFQSSNHSKDRVIVSPAQATSFNVTGLHPSTSYTFRIFAENQLGTGDSATLTLKTDDFFTDPPPSVMYYLSNRTVAFHSPKPDYCGKLETFDGRQWSIYEPCVNATGEEFVVIKEVYAKKVQVAYCLQRRMAICSAAVSVEAGPSRTPELDSLRKVDAGNYTCQAGQEKSQDVLTQEMRLNVQSTPGAPMNLKVQGIAWDSAVLEWQAGSDELFPSTSYTFRIFGENKLGTGDSATITIKTDDFFIDPPPSVIYYSSNRTVTFQSPKPDYCGKLETFDGRQWSIYEPCVNATGEEYVVIKEVYAKKVQVAYCLQRRWDICSATVSVEADESVCSGDSLFSLLESLYRMLYRIAIEENLFITIGAAAALGILLLLPCIGCICCCARGRKSSRGSSYDSDSSDSSNDSRRRTSRRSSYSDRSNSSDDSDSDSPGPIRKSARC